MGNLFRIKRWSKSVIWWSFLITTMAQFVLQVLMGCLSVGKTNQELNELTSTDIVNVGLSNILTQTMWSDFLLTKLVPLVLFMTIGILFIFFNRRYQRERAISIFPENFVGRVAVWVTLALFLLIPCILLLLSVFQEQQVIIEMNILHTLLYYLFVYYVFYGFLLREIGAKKKTRIILPTVILLVSEFLLLWLEVGFCYLAAWMGDVFKWSAGQRFADLLYESVEMKTISTILTLIEEIPSMVGLLLLLFVVLIVSYLFTVFFYLNTRNLIVSVLPALAFWNMLTVMLQDPNWFSGGILIFGFLVMLVWSIVLAIRLFRSEEASDRIPL